MSKRANLYRGRAGHLAVMSELLWRGWNVAIPQVDVGDDIFVVEDERGTFYRVQVKTSEGTHRDYGCSAQYAISLHQLQTPKTPKLIYILALRFNGQWQDYLVIDRQTILAKYETEGMGSHSENNSTINLYIKYETGSVVCSGIDLSDFRNDWNRFFQPLSD
jgi:hypothetical protein